MDNLLYLEEISVNNCIELIKQRFKNKKIYTQLGEVLLSVNPYQYFEGDEDIYTFENNDRVHLFRTLERAHEGMMSGNNQTIIVSGESGSGKTETTKKIVQFLNQLKKKSDSVDNDRDNDTILERIEASGFVLEYFGNAATEKNHNSSRFGKYIELYYQKNGDCIGMKTSAYLLEKTRVLNKDSSGRFHVFNRLNHTDGNDTFRSLLARAGFLNDQIAFIIKCIEMVEELIHLQFGRIDNSTYNSVLLGRKITVQEESIEKTYTESEFNETRDMLAMKLYETLFFWIVDEMNTFNNKQPQTNNALVCIGILDIFGFENLSRNGLEQLCINYANEIVQGLLNKKLMEDKIKLYNEERIPISSTALQLNTGQIDLIERIFMALDEECMLPRGSNRGFIDKLTFHYNTNPYYQISKLSQHQCFCIEHYAGKIEYAIESFVQCNLDKQQINIDTWIQDLFSQIKKKDADKKKRRNSVNTLKIHSISNQFRNNLANFLTNTKDNHLHFIKCIKPNPDQTAMEFNDDIVRDQLVYNGVIQLITILKQGFEYYFLWIPFQRDYGPYMMETDPKEAFVIGQTRIFLTHDYYNILKSRHFEKTKESSIVLQTCVRRSVVMRNYIKIKTGFQHLENRMWCNLIQRDYHLNRSSRRLQVFFRNIMEHEKRRKQIAVNVLVRFVKGVCRAKTARYLFAEKQNKMKAACTTIQKWWRFILRKKYDLHKRNTYLEAQIVQKDCRIWSLERRILELEQRLGRSIVLDKNIIHERDHVIVSLRKDIERYQQNIDERLKEKLNLLEKMDQIKNENRVLIYQLANARNRSNSSWFSRLF